MVAIGAKGGAVRSGRASGPAGSCKATESNFRPGSINATGRLAAWEILPVFRHSVATKRNCSCTIKKHSKGADVRRPKRTGVPVEPMPCGGVRYSVVRPIRTTSGTLHSSPGMSTTRGTSLVTASPMPGPTVLVEDCVAGPIRRSTEAGHRLASTSGPVSAET